jgi:hypothetical protein
LIAQIAVIVITRVLGMIGLVASPVVRTILIIASMMLAVNAVFDP